VSKRALKTLTKKTQLLAYVVIVHMCFGMLARALQEVELRVLLPGNIPFPNWDIHE
jgi:hypothetical protein